MVFVEMYLYNKLYKFFLKINRLILLCIVGFTLLIYLYEQRRNFNKKETVLRIRKRQRKCLGHMMRKESFENLKLTELTNVKEDRREQQKAYL